MGRSDFPGMAFKRPWVQFPPAPPERSRVYEVIRRPFFVAALRLCTTFCGRGETAESKRARDSALTDPCNHAFKLRIPVMPFENAGQCFELPPDPARSAQRFRVKDKPTLHKEHVAHTLDIRTRKAPASWCPLCPEISFAPNPFTSTEEWSPLHFLLNRNRGLVWCVNPGTGSSPFT